MFSSVIYWGEKVNVLWLSLTFTQLKSAFHLKYVWKKEVLRILNWLVHRGWMLVFLSKVIKLMKNSCESGWRVWWDLGKGSGWVTSNAAARMVPVCRAFTRASWSTTRPETWGEIRLQISVSERLNNKLFNRNQISPGDTFVLTSADVDQCCWGFH